MSKLSKLGPDVKLSICNSKANSNSVFGLGIAKLCEGVREKGSLNAAAKDMHMAYSKAWRIIKETEKALDVQLLVREGAHGSHLTPEGEKLIDIYLEISDKLAEEARKLYEKLAQ